MAIFTTGIYALVLSLMNPGGTTLGSRSRAKAPVGAVAAILLLIAVPPAAIQVNAVLSFVITGTIPDPSVLVVPAELTRLGFVLDLSLLVTIYVLAAVLHWRRRGWGFVLAAVLLVSGTLHQVSYYTAMHFQNPAGIPDATYEPFEPVILGLFVMAAALLLANMPAPSRLRRPPGDPDPTANGLCQPQLAHRQ